MSLAEAASVMGARSARPISRRPFPAVSIDSRTIKPGQCFLAVRGARFDGHDFVPEAVGRGAAVVVVSSPVDLSAEAECVQLQVPDTVAALQVLAHFGRKKWGRPLIAVTGSMGKTTTRHFIASLLSLSFRVFQSPGNFNNEFGLPLSLLGLEEQHELAVLELGMNHPGEIRNLARICAPTAAVLTNVAAVHLEFFPDVDAIAEAKGEILESLGLSDLLFWNADDPRLRRLSPRHAGPTISFALDSPADVQITRFSFESLEEMEFEINVRGRKLVGRLPFAGRHFLYNLCAAVAVAHEFGVPLERMAAGLASLQPPSMRGRLSSIGQVSVLDDSYNSNPQALQTMLDTVDRLKGFQRKILALGEMLELGPDSRRFHEECGRLAAGVADFLVTVGEDAAYLAEAAREAGLPPDRAAHFQDSAEAAAYLQHILRPGDFLLVKGSRGAKMDRIVAELEAARKV